MKLIAIVGSNGKVAGTYRPVEKNARGPQGVLKPLEGQTVHEIELPESSAKLSAEELHDKINALLVKSRIPPRCG
jgi:hypothetical protein